MQHRWLAQGSGAAGSEDDVAASMEITPSAAAALETPGGVPKSPFGSPIGQRRALTPTTPDSSLELEPTKKCRCDSGGSNHGDTCNNEEVVVNGNNNSNSDSGDEEIVERELNKENDGVDKEQVDSECVNCLSSETQPQNTTLVSDCNNASAGAAFENSVIDLENRNSSAAATATAAVSVVEISRENCNNEATTTYCQQHHPQHLVPKIEDLCSDATKLSRELMDKEIAVLTDGDIDY